MDAELYARRRWWRKTIKELGETKRKTWAVLVAGQLGIMAVTAWIPQVQDNWLKCIMIAALAIGLYAVFNVVQSLGQLQGAYEICCTMLKLSDEEVRQQGGKLDVEAERGGGNMGYETFKTWEQMAQDASGTPYIDQYVGNVRILVMRGPSALCAYVGLPSEHKLAGKDYNDMPLECHGGLTYGAEGDGQCRPNGWYWYGWDYGHCDDVSFDSDHSDLGCKKWQLGEVYMESIGVALQLHNLMQEQAS